MTDEVKVSPPSLEEKHTALEARVKQLESFLGHIHPAASAPGFLEYPKQVGTEVAWSKEDEERLLAKGVS